MKLNILNCYCVILSTLQLLSNTTCIQAKLAATSTQEETVFWLLEHYFIIIMDSCSGKVKGSAILRDLCNHNTSEEPASCFKLTTRRRTFLRVFSLQEKQNVAQKNHCRENSMIWCVELP